MKVSEGVTAAARQCVTELEGMGPALKYEPIFSNSFRQVTHPEPEQVELVFSVADPDVFCPDPDRT